MSKDPQPKQASSSFIIGAIALVFLAIGYQTALLVHRAATLHIASTRDRPDTVYVIDPATASRLIGDSYDDSAPLPGPQRHQGQQTVVKRNSAHSGPVRQVREQQAERERSRGKVESFRFNPNTVSVEDLIRLGFSPRQAEAIDNYRSKGGRFRRKEDFAKLVKSRLGWDCTVIHNVCEVELGENTTITSLNTAEEEFADEDSVEEIRSRLKNALEDVSDVIENAETATDTKLSNDELVQLKNRIAALEKEIINLGATVSK